MKHRRASIEIDSDEDAEHGLGRQRKKKYSDEEEALESRRGPKGDKDDLDKSMEISRTGKRRKSKEASEEENEEERLSKERLVGIQVSKVFHLTSLLLDIQQ